MPLLFSEIKAEVRRVLTPKIYTEMKVFVEQKDPKFWGEQKPRFFTKRMFVLTMYHDIKGIGYNKLVKQVTTLGFKTSPKSLKYNTKQIRRTLRKWAEEKVKLGKKGDWVSATYILSYIF